MRSHTHCCFCGAYNAKDPVGYAGERACYVCGHGGQGEGRLPVMASDSWEKVDFYGYVPNYLPPLEGNENKIY